MTPGINLRFMRLMFSAVLSLSVSRLQPQLHLSGFAVLNEQSHNHKTQNRKFRTRWLSKSCVFIFKAESWFQTQW